MAERWACRVNGDGFTVEVPCESEADAEVTAYEYLNRGARYGNRIYPTSRVIFCEIIKKEAE